MVVEVCFAQVPNLANLVSDYLCAIPSHVENEVLSSVRSLNLAFSSHHQSVTPRYDREQCVRQLNKFLRQLFSIAGDQDDQVEQQDEADYYSQLNDRSSDSSAELVDNHDLALEIKS